MLALSIKQPYALLIARGIKDIENRTWKIRRPGEKINQKYGESRLQLPQRVVIHAGKKIDDFWFEIEDKVSKELWEELYYGRHFELGALIGEVDIIDCIQDSISPWAIKGQYHFVLANATMYENPIPYRGQLGFFEVDQCSR